MHPLHILTFLYLTYQNPNFLSISPLQMLTFLSPAIEWSSLFLTFHPWNLLESWTLKAPSHNDKLGSSVYIHGTMEELSLLEVHAHCTTKDLWQIRLKCVHTWHHWGIILARGAHSLHNIGCVTNWTQCMKFSMKSHAPPPHQDKSKEEKGG